MLRFGRRHKQAGLSLVELMISMMLLGIIGVALFNVVKTGLNTWRFGDRKMDLMSNTRRALEQMARDIRQGGTESVVITTVDADHDIIEFTADIEYGVAEPGDLELVRYELLPTGEIQQTITDFDASVETNILASNIVSLHFEANVDIVVAIRLIGQKNDLVVNLATKAFPRNV
ncbi:MAG: prepilin-type N-terminal cleavage/methylation domain-containing protein [bacterium]